jgi:hypothetical protein
MEFLRTTGGEEEFTDSGNQFLPPPIQEPRNRQPESCHGSGKGLSPMQRIVGSGSVGLRRALGGVEAKIIVDNFSIPLYT